MTEDPIVDEIHRLREATAQRFNNDLRAFCDDARKRQNTGGRKVVSLPRRKPRPRPSFAQK